MDKNKRRYVIYAAIAVALAGAVVAVMMRPAARQQTGGFGRFRAAQDQPVPTLAATARTADVPVYLDGVGTVRALNTVTVRSQVDGKLIRINFKEGQDVEQGFVLAEIDDTLYQAQLDQAVAKKAQDEAQLANARRDLERYTRLAATNALAPQQADTQKSLVAQFEALVQADQAAIENAEAILTYTKIVAPISGRTGIRQVDVGNIIRSADATGIVTITQLKPISVIFTLPQQKLMQVNAALAQRSLQVEVFGPENKVVVERGVLQVVDNQVDQTTGTIRLKAEFANKDLQLWPGQFLNVRLLVETLEQAVVVPTAAVQRGPNGLFVYAVRDDSTVAMRPVTISQQNETQTVITSGVHAGERVVTTSFNQLSDGRKVAISETEPGAGATPTSAIPSGERSRRPGGGVVQSDQPRAGGQRRSERESSRTP
ncbi:MAG TPA: efflux RND transporter periplasmic adaptor subunit [Xanthobacteraceae bacterium]|nr:efflux RND transporter periplasmic adaptor subunit [Xanthobacteraceae bacterium]